MRTLLDRLEKEKPHISDNRMLMRAKKKIKDEIERLNSDSDKDNRYYLSIDNIMTPEEIDALYSKDDITIPPELENHLAWIYDRSKAPEILKTLWKYMEGKKNPMDVLMALCAALEVGVIRRPTPTEYKAVFKDNPLESDTSLRTHVSSNGAISYRNNDKNSECYKNLVEKFKNI